MSVLYANIKKYCKILELFHIFWQPGSIAVTVPQKEGAMKILKQTARDKNVRVLKMIYYVDAYESEVKSIKYDYLSVYTHMNKQVYYMPSHKILSGVDYLISKCFVDIELCCVFRLQFFNSQLSSYEWIPSLLEMSSRRDWHSNHG